MSAWSSSVPAASVPQQGYARERLLFLMEMIRTEVPGARLSEVIAGSMGFHSVTVELSNGLSLLVSNDADLPEALFEVIRFLGPDDVQQYPFEGRSSLGSAYCNKLPSQAAVDLLKRYTQPDVTPPVTSVPPVR